jgi:RNA polymerase primary sigma factor
MLLRAVSTPLSIDSLEAEFESTGAFASEPFDSLDTIQLGDALAGSLDALDARSAKVIRLRYGIGVVEPCTLEEVGQLFELTRERIRQIEAKAIKRLMHPTRLDKLRPWNDRDQQEKTGQATDAIVPNTRREGEPRANLVVAPAEIEAPGGADVVDRDNSGALERLFARATELGIAVEHTGSGVSRATWVSIDQAHDKQTRGIVRRLLAMGFMHWPGKGYWK